MMDGEMETQENKKIRTAMKRQKKRQTTDQRQIRIDTRQGKEKEKK